MTRAKLIVNDDEVRFKLGKLKSAVRRDVLAQIGMAVAENTRLRFDKSEAPDGTKWRPLSRETLIRRVGGPDRAFTKSGRLRKSAERRMRGAKPLLDTGRLRNSITYRVTKNAVEVGTNVEYASAHQFGRGRIPARPFLGISGDDRAEASSILKRAIERQIKK